MAFHLFDDPIFYRKNTMHEHPTIIVGDVIQPYC